MKTIIKGLALVATLMLLSNSSCRTTTSQQSQHTPDVLSKTLLYLHFLGVEVEF